MELELVEDPGTDTSKPLTLHKRVALVQRWLDLRGRSVLDAGCGGGGYVEYLCALGAQAEGVEYDAGKVSAWSRAHPGDSRIRQGDLNSLPHSDETFDAVLLNEVLEHVTDDDLAIREIRRVLKPGGLLFLFSPNRFHPFETHGFISKRTGHGTGGMKTFLLPYLPVSAIRRWFSPWARNYWPRELRAKVTSCGFGILDHRYVWQTLENNSGHQPAYITRLVPWLRKAFSIAERTPGYENLASPSLLLHGRSSQLPAARPYDVVGPSN